VLLLDTHTYLWFIDNDPRLSATAADRIADPETRVLVSVVTAWEIVIKMGIGKLTLGKPLTELWPETLAANDFGVLDVKPKHVFALETLPLHHRDPFDRLLIAQATSEDLEIVSADSIFHAYPVKCCW
jgi:PIN domain nuclease of toxin-antitoxin system